METGRARPHFAALDQCREKAFAVVGTANGRAERDTGAVTVEILESCRSDGFPRCQPHESVTARTKARGTESDQILLHFSDG